jgi:hypothetical protein
MGIVVTVNGGAIQDIKARIKKASGICVELYPLWMNKNIPMKAKMHRFRNNVKLIMLCRCETWKVTTQIKINYECVSF